MLSTLLLLVPTLFTLANGAATCAAPPSIAARAAAPPLNTTNQSPTPINETVLARARHLMLQNATHSWELGTASQALLEYSWPEIAVFSPTAFLPIKANQATYNVSDVLSIAERTVEQKPLDLPTLVEDGQAGDPASLGISVLYANYTTPNKTYSDAIIRQYKHLMYFVPRAPNGAISHRESEPQLWADFIAMVPPFIAYYGAMQPNKTMMGIAYNQISLYRDVLRDNDTSLWRHIMLGSFQDDSLWSTGNAWAAWGILRVHQTLNHSSFGSEFIKEQEDLLSWATEIVLSAWQDRDEEGLLPNTLGCDVPDDNFGDTASTALITAVTYRLGQIYASSTRKLVLEHSNSTLNENETLLKPSASQSQSAAPKPSASATPGTDPYNYPHNWSTSYTTANLSQPLSLNMTLNGLLEGALEAADDAYETIKTTYLTETGLLNGAVDPLTFNCQLADDQISPEGQAFVLIMEAARRDWRAWVASTAVDSPNEKAESTLEEHRVGTTDVDPSLLPVRR